MRNEMVAAVVRRLAEYPEFRIELSDDPRHALESHGFELDGDDFHFVTGLARKLRSADPASAAQELSAAAQRIGISIGLE